MDIQPPNPIAKGYSPPNSIKIWWLCPKRMDLLQKWTKTARGWSRSLRSSLRWPEPMPWGVSANRWIVSFRSLKNWPPEPPPLHIEPWLWRLEAMFCGGNPHWAIGSLRNSHDSESVRLRISWVSSGAYHDIQSLVYHDISWSCPTYMVTTSLAVAHLCRPITNSL